MSGCSQQLNRDRMILLGFKGMQVQSYGCLWASLFCVLSCGSARLWLFSSDVELHCTQTSGELHYIRSSGAWSFVAMIVDTVVHTFLHPLVTSRFHHSEYEAPYPN